MIHRNPFRLLALAWLVLAATTLASPSHAGWADAIKKKVAEKTGKKVDDATKKADEAADQAMGEKKDAASSTESESANGASTEAGAGAVGNGKVSAISTKFDFVPGDSVIFIDDFTQDELGEFPARWKLVDGTFEVAEMKGERWMRCMSMNGHVRMKVPASLPEFWTIEFDLYNTDPGPIALELTTFTAQGEEVWRTRFPYSGQNLEIQAGKVSANTPLEGGPATGRHHLMVMARGSVLKVYVDQQRLASIPDAFGAGKPAEIDFLLGAPSHPMIANVRLAQGCKPPKDMLATGKLVTYGIRFATGSDVVMPESAPVLRQVASYMETNPTVKLKVTGHTDNVGAAASNLDLSKRRAASVARVLSTEFGVAGDRFATDGKGDTQALSSNTKPEGRAMNRRVEFAKL